MNTTLLAQLGLAAGSALTSGFRLYGTVAALGVSVTASVSFTCRRPPRCWRRTPILILSTALFVVEFLADKIPVVDTIWDAVHTFVRVPAAALLGFAALNDVAEPWRTASRASVRHDRSVSARPEGRHPARDSTRAPSR